VLGARLDLATSLSLLTAGTPRTLPPPRPPTLTPLLANTANDPFSKPDLHSLRVCGVKSSIMMAALPSLTATPAPWPRRAALAPPPCQPSRAVLPISPPRHASITRTPALGGGSLSGPINPPSSPSPPPPAAAAAVGAGAVDLPSSSSSTTASPRALAVAAGLAALAGYAWFCAPGSPGLAAALAVAAQAGARLVGTSAAAQAAAAGLAAGCLHTLSGPDHLAALTPLTIGRTSAAAAAMGALWGFGHSIGQLMLGLAMLLLKVRFLDEDERKWLNNKGQRDGLRVLCSHCYSCARTRVCPCPVEACGRE
jgi:hypothetical protein